MVIVVPAVVVSVVVMLDLARRVAVLDDRTAVLLDEQRRGTRRQDRGTPREQGRDGRRQSGFPVDRHSSCGLRRRARRRSCRRTRVRAIRHPQSRFPDSHIRSGLRRSSPRGVPNSRRESGNGRLPIPNRPASRARRVPAGAPRRLRSRSSHVDRMPSSRESTESRGPGRLAAHRRVPQGVRC